MTANVIEEVAPAWPGTIREEFEANKLNGRVGTRLLSETDRVRVRQDNFVIALWRGRCDSPHQGAGLPDDPCCS